MSYVGQFLLTSVGQYIVDIGWYIKFTHLLPGELPVFLAFTREVRMFTTVFVASVVAEPAVEASAGHLESRSDIWRVNYPNICTIDNSMLKEHYGFSNVALASLNSSDAE